MQRITFKGSGRTELGTVIKEYTHGYTLPSGAWCACDIGGGVPTEWVQWRPYRKKKALSIEKRHIEKTESLK